MKIKLALKSLALGSCAIVASSMMTVSTAAAADGDRFSGVCRVGSGPSVRINGVQNGGSVSFRAIAQGGTGSYNMVISISDSGGKYADGSLSGGNTATTFRGLGDLGAGARMIVNSFGGGANSGSCSTSLRVSGGRASSVVNVPPGIVDNDNITPRQERQNRRQQRQERQQRRQARQDRQQRRQIRQQRRNLR